MIKAVAPMSDKGFLFSWIPCAVLIAGLLAVAQTGRASDYGRHGAAPTASAVHYGAAPAGSVPVHSGGPVQRIPAYGPAGAYPATQQAAFTHSVPTMAPAAAESVLRAYDCTPSQGAVLSAALNEQFRGRGDVRIYHDTQMSQLLVMAPESVQQQIAAQIQAVTSVSGRSLAPQASTTASANMIQRGEYQLKHVPAERLESVLRVALGSRWSRLSQEAAVAPSYQVAVAGGGALTLQLDPVRNRVLLEGPPGAAYHSCAQLVESLDAPKPSDDQARCVVTLTTLTVGDLAEAVEAIRTADGPAAPGAVHGVLLAQAVADEEEFPRDDDEEVTATIPLPGAGAGGAGLIGPVRIEMLEGLDVIVIRGHKRDVQQVVEIIQEIERLSIETEPTVLVHPLRHVNSEAVTALVQQVYQQVFLPRQGPVSITALVKPNSLLLIGRPDSVSTVVDLVKKLDRPVPPETQFKLFRLRHAPAATVQATIESFFEERPSLGTQVRVIADFRSNSLIVQASPRDMAEVGRMIADVDTRSVEAVNDLRVFKLRNTLAETLQPILQSAITGQVVGQAQQNVEQKSIGLRFVTIDPEGRKLLSSGILTDVRITADPRANALLIAAPPESMPLIEALIQQLDQLPGAEAQLKVFTIVNGDAQALAEMLGALFGQAAAAAQPPVRTGAGEGDSALVPLRFAVDIRTNSIIASGSVGDLAVVEAILLRLDESEVRKRLSVVYRLKNAPAADVAAAVNQYLSGETQVRAIEQGLFSTYEIFEREVVVVAEPVSNSLIVSTTPEYYDEIKALVEQLDERPPMVMIQVLIAEVHLNDTEEFGIEIGLQDSVLFDRSLLGDIQTITQTTQQSTADGVVTVTEQIITSATQTPGFLFSDVTRSLGNSGAARAQARSNVVGSQGLSNFAVGRFNSELGFGGLVLSASSESVSMLLRALKEERRINVLSRPQIMTLDNQPAFIQVGQRVPRVSGTQTNQAGGITNTVTLENVGLILGVTPRISPDGLVVMEIDAEKSEVGPEAEGIPISITEGQTIRSPKINTTTAQTTVSALDGQTVVLGGLITTNKIKIDRRVPFLSEIPVLGQLFRFQGYTSKRSELLIVMTPRIVESEEDAQVIKQAEACRMNWCLNDVLEMHHDVAFRPRDGEWADGETTTIYPDNTTKVEQGMPLENVPLDGPMPQIAPPNASGDTRGSLFRHRTPEAGRAERVDSALYSQANGYGQVDGLYPATDGYSPAWDSTSAGNHYATPSSYSAPSTY